MSGHSKWANIKRQKAVVDAKKGAIYAKMSREIIVAARMGGGDPQSNFRLRQAIDRAKAEGVPNDNIQKAIDKGTGAGVGDDLQDITYEGYGPSGVAIMVVCTTDNRNRTAGFVRTSFSKYGGNLGETGCVNWLFKERGEIVIASEKIDDELLAKAIEAGAEDIETGENTVIICEPNDLDRVKEVIAQSNYKITTSETVMLPSTYIEISELSIAKQLLKLLDVLEDNEDVQKVYSNFDMNEDLVKEVMS
jgi:YebC/PmpR family DNA-binding regulatory protein